MPPRYHVGDVVKLRDGNDELPKYVTITSIEISRNQSKYLYHGKYPINTGLIPHGEHEILVTDEGILKLMKTRDGYVGDASSKDEVLRHIAQLRFIAQLRSVAAAGGGGGGGGNNNAYHTALEASLAQAPANYALSVDPEASGNPESINNNENPRPHSRGGRRLKRRSRYSKKRTFKGSTRKHK